VLCASFQLPEPQYIFTAIFSVDESILQHMINTNAEFLMEVTDKTKADIKGGTLIGMLKLFSFQPLLISLLFSRLRWLNPFAGNRSSALGAR